MHAVNISTLKAMVRDAVELNEPLLVLGQFGAGKSEAIRQTVEEIGGELVDIRLGQYDSVDLRGTPWRSEQNFTQWCPASTLPFVGNDAFPDDRPITLFLDELTSASAPVMGICYQLVLERCIGEHKLKDNVRIIAAGNRQVDKGVVNRMPEPLKNRFTQVELIIDVQALCNYAMKQGWPQEFIAFWQFRGIGVVCTYDPKNPLPVVATPRTWEKAIKYYKHNSPKDVQLAQMSGSIGEGPCTEFWGFIDVWKSLTPIKQVIANPKGVPLPDELSAQYAMAVSVSGHMNLKNAGPLTTYLERYATELGKVDLLIMAWHLALARDEEMFKSPEFIKFSKNYHVVF